MISKQDNMVLLAGLDLHMCSEIIDNVSISGGYRLSEDNHVSKGNSLLKNYGSRKDNLSLSFDDDLISSRKMGRGGKCIIPHYVGGKTFPVYLPTKDYARSVLLLYKPWVGTFVEEDQGVH